MKPLTTSLIIAALALSFTVQAKPAQHHYDYARVINVTPTYNYVTHRVPVQECWETEYRPKHKSHVSTVVGSIIGGAVGHAIGHNKSNKKVGLVAGAALGAAIGSDIEAKKRHQYHNGYGQHSYQTCETSFEMEREKVLSGYKVTYRYQGKRYHTRTKHHPGDRIKVRVSVLPVDEYRSNY